MLMGDPVGKISINYRDIKELTDIIERFCTSRLLYGQNFVMRDERERFKPFSIVNDSTFRYEVSDIFRKEVFTEAMAKSLSFLAEAYLDRENFRRILIEGYNINSCNFPKEFERYAVDGWIIFVDYFSMNDKVDVIEMIENLEN